MTKQQHKMREVYSSQTIATRVGEIAKAINATYAGQELVVVCVLKGAVMFFSDLIRQLNLNVEIDFVRLSSYGNSTQSCKAICLTKDIEISLQGKHVLLVEDILDSGLSMDFLFKHLEACGLASLRLAVLIDKKDRRETAISADFTGFTLDKGFVVGYGLDFAEQYRQLPGIYEIIEPV